MKKLLFLILLAFSHVFTSCKNVENGLVFEFNEEDMTAQVKGVKNTKITEVKIPSEVEVDGKIYSVTEIMEFAFDGCESLTSIVIPNSVATIENRAFYGCKSLESIEIPNSVIAIGGWAFSVCTSLTSIVVDKNNKVYDSRENCNAIIETASNTLITGCQNTAIPNSVTKIGGGAFVGCRNLTRIELPTSVTEIGGSAFAGCTNLTSIEIPNSVKMIGSSAFSDCRSLTSIEIPKSVTTIGDCAFYNCISLTSIEIPKSVTEIGEYAFWYFPNLYSSKLKTARVPKNCKIGEKSFPCIIERY